MRGEKRQIWAVAIGLGLSAGAWPASTHEAPPPASLAMAIEPSGALTVPPFTPSAAAETTTTQLRESDAPLPLDQAPATAQPEKSDLEVLVHAIMAPQKLGEVGLKLVGIVPPDSSPPQDTLQPRVSDSTPTPEPAPQNPKYVYAFVTGDGACASAFAIHPNKSDPGNPDKFSVGVVFSGKLPDVANPEVFDGPQMFDNNGDTIIQAETAEWWPASLSDMSSLATINKKMCDAYTAHLQDMQARKGLNSNR